MVKSPTGIASSGNGDARQDTSNSRSGRHSRSRSAGGKSSSNEIAPQKEKVVVWSVDTGEAEKRRRRAARFGTPAETPAETPQNAVTTLKPANATVETPAVSPNKVKISPASATTKVASSEKAPILTPRVAPAVTLTRRERSRSAHRPATVDNETSGSQRSNGREKQVTNSEGANPESRKTMSSSSVTPSWTPAPPPPPPPAAPIPVGSRSVPPPPAPALRRQQGSADVATEIGNAGPIKPVVVSPKTNPAPQPPPMPTPPLPEKASLTVTVAVKITAKNKDQLGDIRKELIKKGVDVGSRPFRAKGHAEKLEDETMVRDLPDLRLILSPEADLAPWQLALTKRAVPRSVPSQGVPGRLGPMQVQMNPFYKTRICTFWSQANGHCTKGNHCVYAHGPGELRARPSMSVLQASGFGALRPFMQGTGSFPLPAGIRPPLFPPAAFAMMASLHAASAPQEQEQIVFEVDDEERRRREERAKRFAPRQASFDDEEEPKLPSSSSRSSALVDGESNYPQAAKDNGAGDSTGVAAGLDSGNHAAAESEEQLDDDRIADYLLEMQEQYLSMMDESGVAPDDEVLGLGDEGDMDASAAYPPEPPIAEIASGIVDETGNCVAESESASTPAAAASINSVAGSAVSAVASEAEVSNDVSTS